MIFKIDGTGGLKGVDKTKAKKPAGSVGGPSFADLLDEAQGVDAAEQAPVMGGPALAGGYVPIEEELPRDAKGQARELMKTLKDLAGSALGGESPAAAVQRLDALAAGVDESLLTPEQKRVLDEVKTRAAVEVAKLKG